MDELIRDLRLLANGHRFDAVPIVTKAADALTTLQAREATLIRALEFYRDEWKKAEHGLGFAGPDMVPTHKLVCDYGGRATEALAFDRA
jgi:hypothetical protein